MPPGTFVYSPLHAEKREIRLLTLHAGAWESEIRCDLKHESLDNPPDYEALSYEWGPQDNPRQIRLEYHRFGLGAHHLRLGSHSLRLSSHRHNVTQNLEAALRHLRSPSNKRVLWIDAICINQSDLDERAQQVQQIRSIYTQAKTVLAWVGLATEHSDDAIDTLQQLGQLMDQHGDELLNPKAGSDTEEMIHSRMEAHGFSLASRNWSHVWEFLERPYWSRIWVLQELAVRGLVTTVLPCQIICGTAYIDKLIWHKACFGLLFLIWTIRSVTSAGDILEPNKSRLLRSKGHAPGLSMHQAIVAANSTTQTPTLLWMQLVTWRFEATDDRDMIFALLGLVPDNDKAVEPNYTKPTSDVLMDYVTFFINRDKSLDCIGSNRRAHCSTLPTWAPELHTHHYAHETCLGGEILIRHYNASSSRPAEVQFDRDRKILSVRGTTIGTVQGVIGPWSVDAHTDGCHKIYDDVIASPEMQAMKQFFDSLKRFLADSAMASDRLEAFWRTLIADKPAEAMVLHMNDDVELSRSDIEHGFRIIFGLDSIPHDGQPENPNYARLATIVEPFSKAANSALPNRTFFTLSDGRMGLGPYFAEMGDLVVVLYGSKVPFVLRPASDGCYQVIGKAYCHGVMQGEALQSESFEEQVFKLC
jgi:hypothetical protein